MFLKDYGKKKIDAEQLERAKKLQATLAQKLKILPLNSSAELIAGVDAAFYEDKVIGSACLFERKKTKNHEEQFILEKEEQFILEKIDEQSSILDVDFPYIPGFLSFREAPVMIKVIEKLIKAPQIILVDGQGIAHPRRFGIACHIGVKMGLPSVGVAKSRLVGTHKEPGAERGNYECLYYNEEQVGVVLRTKTNIKKPLFISPGHLIDIKDSMNIVLACGSKYKLPEPTRCAHLAAEKHKKKVFYKNNVRVKNCY